MKALVHCSVVVFQIEYINTLPVLNLCLVLLSMTFVTANFQLFNLQDIGNKTLQNANFHKNRYIQTNTKVESSCHTILILHGTRRFYTKLKMN